MPPLSIDSVIDTCLRTIFMEEPSLGFFFTSDGVLLLLPTTLRIAGRLGMPHYYVLPPTGVLETEGNLTRAERVGGRTTPAGTRRLFDRADAGTAPMPGPSSGRTRMHCSSNGQGDAGMYRQAHRRSRASSYGRAA